MDDSDVEVSASAEESTFQASLRHRNLLSWLDKEVKSDIVCEGHIHQQVLRLLLQHQVPEAKKLAAKLDPQDNLVRAIGICGCGNIIQQQLSPSSPLFPQWEEVVSVLLGEVHPFIDQTMYQISNGVFYSNANAVTWKQILGIFAFYGCKESTSVEDIVTKFSQRIRARREGALPPYAATLSSAFANTNRGQDIIGRGSTFEDSCLLILEGYGHNKEPSCRVLHAGSSVYVGGDHLISFMILNLYRSMGVKSRTSAWADAESHSLLCFAQQLESSSAWSWGALPLSMILDRSASKLSLNRFLSRNAARQSSYDTALYQQLQLDSSVTKMFKVDTVPLLRDDRDNAPSLGTVQQLQLDLQLFCKPATRR